MRLMIALLALLAVSGCASFSTETKVEESVWQTLNVVDAYQTAHISDHPLFYEREMAWLIGRRPTPQAAYAGLAGMAVVHFMVTAILEEHAPRSVRRLWQAIELVDKGTNVTNNWRIGLRF